MALRVWLPLDGDLRNLGCSGNNFTINTTPVYVNNGKIGKAMSTGQITMPAAMTNSILNKDTFSFTCWIYVNAESGNTTNRAMIFGNSGMTPPNNRRFSIFQYPSCNDLHLSWQNEDSSSTFAGGVWSGIFPSYQWTHLAITYNNPNGTIYINGNKYGSFTGTQTSSSFAYDTILFSNIPNAARYLNDYRIYDHCLSAAEVHEISQGLVLHYKLDDITNGVKDSSGYGHNGNYVNATNSLDTTRYNASMACIGTTVDNSSNTIDGAQFFYCNMDMPATNTITIAWWNKIMKYGRGGIFETSNSIQTNTTKGTDYNTTAFANWDSTFGIYNGSTRVNIFSNFAHNGEWHHHAITFDGANVKYYLDGILKQTSALTGNLPAWKNFCIGLGRAGGVWRQIQQNVSDFRIYRTALSADDILSLYHTSAKVDNKGNWHTYELCENSNQSKILKTGVSETSSFIEEGYTLLDSGSWTYNPTGASNSCAGNLTVDFSDFLELQQPLTITLEGDISWSNIAPNGNGTFAARFQGNNQQLDGTWVWAGSNYAHPGTNQTSAMTANATGTQHFKVEKTIPASWFNTYKASHVSYRTDYATGTITLTNFTVTISANHCKIKSANILSNNFIEF